MGSSEVSTPRLVGKRFI